ncbi:MAG: peptidylprolyl isomerase [Marinilabiliales bacterium]|nr:MAG: peptidylprolyl isomerase [Marinilabiliales bacterium]
MKKTFLGLMVLLVFAVVISSCESGNGEYQTTENGLKYKFHEKNPDGRVPVKGDIIEVKMTYQTPDTVLFNSDELPQPLKMRLDEPVFKGDLYEGIYLMHEGDSATFACNTDSVFTKLFRQKATPAEFDSIENIMFNIRLLSVKSQEEDAAEIEAASQLARDEEQKILDEYLATNNITEKPTESGLIFILTEKGSGEKPQKGDVVKVHYTGYLLDGTKFDSSVDRGQPFEFPLGAGRVIPGWDEGIAMLNVGGKATLIIPSKIAYGARGAGGMIPAYATLKFDVELLGIEKGK